MTKDSFLHKSLHERYHFAQTHPFKSELNYQCLIFRVIDQYGQFENGRRKIHDFTWNVLLYLIFLKYGLGLQSYIVLFVQVFSNAGMWYVRLNPKWLPENDQENVQNFTFFANILGAHVLLCKKTPTIGVIWFSDTPWVTIIWLVLNLSSNISITHLRQLFLNLDMSKTWNEMLTAKK